MSYFDEREKDKARAEQVWDKVLEEMLILYYPPHRSDDDIEFNEQVILALRAYVEDLMEFDSDVLRYAWREVRRAHKVERWPTIQVIRDACFEAGQVKQTAHTVVPDEALYRRRVETHRRTGYWGATWGMPPEETPQQRAEVHRKWLASRTFAERDHFSQTVRRLESGESAVSILQGMDRPNEMPLLPGESLSRHESDRRRAASIQKAEWDKE